jgi:hypothetical protein
MRGGGGGLLGLSQHEYCFALGTQINFRDLTPYRYLTYGWNGYRSGSAKMMPIRPVGSILFTKLILRNSRTHTFKYFLSYEIFRRTSGRWWSGKRFWSAAGNRSLPHIQAPPLTNRLLLFTFQISKNNGRWSSRECIVHKLSHIPIKAKKMPRAAQMPKNQLMGLARGAQKQIHWIRIQSGPRALMTKNGRKKIQQKFFSFFFW